MAKVIHYRKDTHYFGETNVAFVLQKDACVQRLHRFVINNSDFLFTLLLAAAWMWWEGNTQTPLSGS